MEKEARWRLTPNFDDDCFGEKAFLCIIEAQVNIGKFSILYQIRRWREANKKIAKVFPRIYLNERIEYIWCKTLKLNNKTKEKGQIIQTNRQKAIQHMN